jgi:hypothetical protein
MSFNIRYSKAKKFYKKKGFGAWSLFTDWKNVIQVNRMYKGKNIKIFY